jgi:signal transduction histidine kinase
VLLEGLLKTVLAGQPDSYEETPRFADDRARFMEVTGRPLIDDEGCVTGALILREDVTARVQRERRRQVLFDIHQTVWRMSNSDDLESVLVAVRDGLKDLDLPFEDCGVNLIDDSLDPPAVRTSNMTGDGHWIASVSAPGTDVVLGIWRSGETAYRRDLDVDDALREGDGIERVFAHRIRSVVDVPFRRGTFAVNSLLPDAFLPADIELIEEVTRTLDDGFSRVADLMALEVRNRQLEATIRERSRLETESRAFHDVREEVWRMERVDDIDRVIVAVRQCLDALKIDVEGCSIHVVDDNTDPPTVTSFRNRREETVWVRSVTEFARDTIVALWRSGTASYRNDLSANDVMGESHHIGDTYGLRVRSVLDVPYSRGTLGLNNSKPNAFSERDIEAVSRLAEILSEGFGRLADIEQLEGRNRELELEIAERQNLEEQLRRAQKMEAVGQLTAGLAHNFNNILQAIVGNLELARRGDAGDPAPLLRDAEAAAHRAGEIIQHMLVFSRRDTKQVLSVVDFEQLVDQTIGICRRTFDRRIEILLDLTTPLPAIRGDQGQLEQVLLNLMINARDALRDADDPRIHVRAEVRHLDSHQLARPESPAVDYVVVAVHDNGIGIAEADRRRIFDPFFTTKAVGEGTGLGLFTAYGIVDGLEGWIECDSEPGRGATFSILLPASTQTEAAPPGDAEPVNLLGSETILVIDDEEVVLATVARMLSSLGYRVLTAAGGEAGLALLADRCDEVELVLLDLSMPRLSGQEVYERIRRDDGALPVLIFTGYAAADRHPEGVPVVHKPFTMQSLARAVRGTLEPGPAG